MTRARLPLLDSSCGLLPVSAVGLLKGQELSGTLKKVHETGTVVIGYRESSLPFSYLNARGEPIGYSIDWDARLSMR